MNYSINFIFKNLEAEIIIRVFIDFSKAYDTIIDLKNLLIKFENCGIRGTCHDLLESYMSNRMQYIDFQNTLSDLSIID